MHFISKFIFVLMHTDEYYMQRCLQLASNGLGTTYPNPLVGSVIVKNDKVIGEGWHLKSGKPHAEVNAIANAKDYGYTKADFENSTIYVNLEPCSHTGRTPPCADLIIKSGFKTAVVGTEDPHKKVAGNGIARLRESGIEVKTNVLVNECNELNKRFFTYHKNQRPYIILKWAESEDGFIAPLKKDHHRPVWLSSTVSRQLTHKLRAEEQAILVGAKTYINDTPQLNARDYHGADPIRYIWATEMRTMENLREEFRLVETKNVKELVHLLFKDQIQSIIIEGGTRTIQQFINAGLWDETHRFMATQIQLKNGIKAPRLDQSAILKDRKMIATDVFKIYQRS